MVRAILALWSRGAALALVVTAMALASAAAVHARQIDVALRFDHTFLRQAIVDQVFEGSATEKMALWDDGSGCGFLRLWDPQVTTVGNRIRLVMQGEGRVGTALGDTCLAPVQWDGFLEVLEEPQVSLDRNAVEFRVVDSHLYDRAWKKPLVTGNLWDLVKPSVQSRFQAVRIDVAPPLRDLRELLPELMYAGDTARLNESLDSLRLARVQTTDTGLVVTVIFDVTPLIVESTPVAEPTLTPEELQRWEAAWQQWDAFLTFVIKQLGRDTASPELDQGLSDTLLEARYDIVEALAPSIPGAADPTPVLFVKTWERLAPIVRNSATNQPGTIALRYLSFIAAGDALAALEQIGPQVGLDISADGLRRLARIIAPENTEDPLVYSTEVDPELRELLGFGAPLPPPELPEEPDPGSVSWWRAVLQSRPALATAEPPPAKSLEQWLPTREQIDAYLQAVRQVLDDVTAQSLSKTPMSPAHQNVYRRMVLATAWQESCWRQFVRDGGVVTYIRSPVGAVGLMQINEKVWRGLYDLRGLRWDIRYNGRAGAEILQHYLKDYAVARKEHTQPGGIDNLARATYAVYNGGPGHLARYRKPGTPRLLQRIDDHFWEKYQAVTEGRELEVSKCIIGG